MKAKKTKLPHEPMGIVIAGTPAPPTATIFAAYVWGPAPANPTEDDATAS
jgi:hypothetical protein